MTTVQEIVVKATPDGMDDVVSQTNEMESAVKDSTEEMNDQAEAMSDLSEKFQGAMGAIVTGLAVAAAGLLAQIPILGELFGALGAVLDAVAFQLDRVFRPVLAPVTDLILDLADAIFEAEGPLAVAFLKDFATRAKQAANDVVKRITGAFTSLVDKAKDWGKSLIEKLVKGIKSAAGAVQDIVEGINLTAGVTIGDVAGTAGEIAGAASDAGSDFIGSVGSSAANVYLDGTRVDDNQGRYRKDALARRGG